MPDAIHPNLAIMHKLDTKNLDACADIFADNFVWYYFNSNWPELEGDYQGVSGLKDFFAKMIENSNGTIQVNPVDIRAVGDNRIDRFDHRSPLGKQSTVSLTRYC